ncbi:MAG: DUF4860 domain-containing protein [Coriobacteriales bacterium]|jgi:hypothetical protein|nr:DUF4860 domain-containing protein [Coriobacteriales bacterium]
MSRRHSADILVVLTLFCVYTLSALLLVVIGARVYQDTAAVMTSNYDQRTSVLYVAEKLRQSDAAGAVRFDAVAAGDGAGVALVLTEQESGLGYETWIYVAEGTLYEQLVAPGDRPQPTLSQAIMPMQAMTLGAEAASDGLLEITFTTIDNSEHSITLYLNSTQGGVA